MTHYKRRSTDNPDSGLMESNALLRKVIDENPNIVMMKDWDGKFLLANRALATLYGTTPEALIGKDDGDFNPNAEQVAFYLQNVREVMLQDKAQVVMEVSTNAATGETVHYQSTKIPLTGPDGQPQILIIANDVSELKKTQQKLEESERRLRYVLEATGEGIWDWDMASSIVTHNQRWCQIIGLDDNYLQHPLSTFADLLHPDDKDQVIDRLRASLAGKSAYQSEHRLCLKDQRVIWVSDRGNVVERDAQGNPLRMVGSVVDISERKSAELLAEKSAKLLKEAVESIAQGFTIYDEQDRLFLCNEAYKRFYWLSRDLIVPGNTFEMIVRQGAERGQYRQAEGNIDAWVRQRVAQHQQANGEVIEQQLDDGRWLLIVESRTPSGFIVGNRLDITARKLAEAQVKEHSAQLDTIFALSPDGFVSFDEAHCVKVVSPAFTRLTGLTETQVMGLDETVFSQRLAAICLPSATFPGMAALRASMQSGMGAEQRQVIELSPFAAGSQRVLTVALKESRIHSVSQVLYLRDITHETVVDRMKSEFLSTAAHELRTPMASIYGFAELLLTQKLQAAERKEFLEIIFKQADLMSAILNELLDLARIEARRGKDFVLETLSAQHLASDVVSSFKLPAGRRSPAIDAPKSALLLQVDRKKASQAVLNVLSNAYKYSTVQGLVSLSIFAEGDRVAIRIADQGIGMSSAQKARVGERFFRADTSGKVPGTGLGMSIVKEIMTLHHGHVELDSESGVGTTVTLRFPAVSPQPTAAPPAPAAN
ncbi:PAS domain S-box protein [Rhodoferax sp. 4810]|nr:PAS domain S-box protein [Rhodoferax jenense]